MYKTDHMLKFIIDKQTWFAFRPLQNMVHASHPQQTYSMPTFPLGK